MADTNWIKKYEAEIEEATAAKAKVDLEPSPRVWPISGPTATEFNPDGYPLSKRIPIDPFEQASTLHDERTQDMKRVHKHDI